MSCIIYIHLLLPDPKDVGFLGSPGSPFLFPNPTVPWVHIQRARQGWATTGAFGMMEPHGTVSSGDSEFADQVPVSPTRCYALGTSRARTCSKPQGVGKSLNFQFFSEVSGNYFIEWQMGQGAQEESTFGAGIRGALSTENLKTITELTKSRSAFYYLHRQQF